jgi:hypothetical protein
MKRNEVFFFWKGPFSQWERRPVLIDGVEYNCCEQWMMAAKARLFNDKETERKVMASAEPSEQQQLGRQVQSYDQAKWEADREEIVYRGNLAKFQQHVDLRERLLATGSKILAEDNPGDRVWGIGLVRDDPQALDRTAWGQNLLGEALMRVRAILQQSG